jgi:hypothetical protein
MTLSNLESASKITRLPGRLAHRHVAPVGGHRGVAGVDVARTSATTFRFQMSNLLTQPSREAKNT